MIRNIIWGIIVIAIGAWIWISRVNPQALPAPVFSRDWPLIIVIVGLSTIIDGIAGLMRRRR